MSEKCQHVVGAVHTNTIEGFLSIFKRGIVGTFHSASKRSLHLYVAEFQLRYNNRFNDEISEWLLRDVELNVQVAKA